MEKKTVKWNGKKCIVIATYETYSLCSYLGSDSKFSIPNKEIFAPDEEIIIHTINRQVK